MRAARATATGGMARRPRKRWRPRCARLEGPECAGVALAPSGLAAISVALLSVLKAGDHVLVTDSVYLPTRKFCNGLLTRYGITTTYYDPLIGAGIAALIQPNTRAVFVEAPGSLSFEMQDVPAIAAAAHAKGAVVLMDNTWATPLYFRRLREGRRPLDPGRHQIYRRPFRHHVRHGVGQRRQPGGASTTRCTSLESASGPTMSISRSVACAAWACVLRISINRA